MEKDVLIDALNLADNVLNTCCDLALTTGAELRMENEPDHAVNLFDTLGLSLNEAHALIHSTARYCKTGSTQEEKDMKEACDFNMDELKAVVDMAEKGSCNFNNKEIKNATKRAEKLFSFVMK